MISPDAVIPGPAIGPEPGIHTLCTKFWVPGSRDARPGMTDHARA
jgi:hypothetical protein